MDPFQEINEVKSEKLIENKFEPPVGEEQKKNSPNDTKKEEIEVKLEKNYPAQVNEHPIQSPTALQDPSTISLHPTDLEPNTSTSSLLPTKLNTQSDVQKSMVNQPIDVVQRYEEPPPLLPLNRSRDLWYDIGVFTENKCFVTHFIQNTIAATNQEVKNSL